MFTEEDKITIRTATKSLPREAGAVHVYGRFDEVHEDVESGVSHFEYTTWDGWRLWYFDPDKQEVAMLDLGHNPIDKAFELAGMFLADLNKRHAA